MPKTVNIEAKLVEKDILTQIGIINITILPKIGEIITFEDNYYKVESIIPIRKRCINKTFIEIQVIPL